MPGLLARTPNGHGLTSWPARVFRAELIKYFSKICAISISVPKRADLLTAFLDYVVGHL